MDKKEMYFIRDYPEEPLILEPEDYTDEEWAVIIKIFSMEKAERIKISNYKFEAWGYPKQQEKTHDIHLTVKADECPYWNYNDQTCTHTCGGCDDLRKGNTIDTVHCGVMIDGNRYCMLNCDIYGEIIKSLEKENENEGSFI